MILGELIRCYRIVNQVEQTDLARAMGVGPKTLARFEKGQDVEGPAVAAILHWLTAPDCPRANGTKERKEEIVTE